MPEGPPVDFAGLVELLEHGPPVQGPCAPQPGLGGPNPNPDVPGGCFTDAEIAATANLLDSLSQKGFGSIIKEV